jgi:hypothetical protein
MDQGGGGEQAGDGRERRRDVELAPRIGDSTVHRQDALVVVRVDLGEPSSQRGGGPGVAATDGLDALTDLAEDEDACVQVGLADGGEHAAT